ncbi:MAG: ACT domain-containing protein, partial [Pseudomonadota bacterium]
ADIGEARLTPSKALAAVYPELAAAAEAEMTAEAGAPGSPGAGDSARQQAPISELAPARAVVDPKRPQVVLSKRRGGAPTADGDLAAGAELAETNGRMTLPAAPCCRPIPGERIVALAEPEVGYRLHAIDCAALAAHEDDMDRWLDVVWAPEASAEAEHGASVEVFLANEPGALGEICTMIGRSGANIDGVEVLERGTDFHRIRFDMDVRDIRHLSNILTALSAQPIVADAVRLGRADEREIDPEMGLRPTLDADPMAEEPAIEPADPVEAQAAEEASAQRGDGGEAAGQGRRANENRTPPGVEAQQTHNHGAA